MKENVGSDFTVGAVMPQLVSFFLPFLLANLLNSIYNTVDTVIIGKLVGSTGIVAVTMGGKLLNLYTHLGVALSGGSQVLISQQVGAGRRRDLNATIGTMFTEMTVVSLIFAVGSLIFSRDIITWLNTPAESFDSALKYLRITCIGLPLIFGYNAVSSALRGMGDSRSPLLFIAIAAVFNLVGDIVFIVFFHMDAAGTAIATVLGQGVSLAFSLRVLYIRRERFGFDFRPSSFRPDFPKLRIMVAIGMPMALRTVFICVTQLVLIRYVNLYGLVQAAAYSVGDKIVQLTNMFSMSVRQAAAAMVGQNIGAGRYDRVRTIVRDSLGLVLGAAAVLSAASLLFPRLIFSAFTSDPEVLAYAKVFMAISCIIYFLSALMGPYEAVISGTGSALLGLLGGLLDGVVFRICFSFLFAYTFGLGVTGFFLGDALARLGPVTVGMLYYHTGAWMRHKKLTE